MKNTLKNMTLEELWQLFPIVLVPHNPQWSNWAREEIALLSALLSGYNPTINHIGSTAVPDICAKPIIDIIVEVSADIDWLSIKPIMECGGYICMAESDNRISFNKGYTPAGYAEKVFHIHFHKTGDNEILKLSLLPKYKNDRDGYTEAKSEFVLQIIKRALKQ